MGCVPAQACIAALDQATGLWPARNRASDGICGDPSHQARVSDHNQGEAFDLTHDPAHGVDCNRLAEHVKNDPRVKYVIWNRRIWNPSISQSWRTYTGSNPHTHHMHVSILRSARDNTAAWFIGGEEEDMPLSEGDLFKIAITVAKVLDDRHDDENNPEYKSRRIAADLAANVPGIDRSKLKKETRDYLAKQGL